MKFLNGWRLTGLIALIVAVISFPLLIAGAQEESIRAFLRITARCSALLFLTAFSASALVRIYPASWTRWTARNRRYIGVGFAVSHTFHLGGILLLFTLKPDEFINTAGLVTMIGGGIAFLLLYAMTATSFDRSAAWLGSKNWRILHKTGMYFFWTIFFLDYVLPAMQSPIYFFFALLVITALVLRIVAWRLKKKTALQLQVQS